MIGSNWRFLMMYCLIIAISLLRDRATTITVRSQAPHRTTASWHRRVNRGIPPDFPFLRFLILGRSFGGNDAFILKTSRDGFSIIVAVDAFNDAACSLRLKAFE